MAAKRLSVEEVIEAVLEDGAEEDREDVSRNNDEVGENDEGEMLLHKSPVPGPGISRILYSCNINAGTLFQVESLFWLKAIYRRLGGRQRIRRPYYSEIKRDIPEAMFLGLVRSIKICESPILSEPNCYVAQNKKAMVVSFTCLSSVKDFLSSLSKKEVSGYFERTLAGYRKDHQVKVLVTETKDFALAYYFNRGQLVVSFNLGEWNAYGFPQHNCTL